MVILNRSNFSALDIEEYSSITDIEHSPNYTASGLPQTHQVR